MGDTGIFWPTVIMAGASVVNVIVLIGYAISTRGIRQETQRSAANTERLAQQSWDTLKLQVALYLGELRNRVQWFPQNAPEIEPSRKRAVTTLTASILAIFSEETQQAEIRKLIKLVFGVEPE